MVATTAGRIYQPPPFFPGCLGWSNFKITGLINLCPTQDFKYLFVAKAFLLPKNVNIYIQVKKIILPERNFWVFSFCDFDEARIDCANFVDFRWGRLDQKAGGGVVILWKICWQFFSEANSGRNCWKNWPFSKNFDGAERKRPGLGEVM